MRDRNEWFKEAKGALRHLEINVMSVTCPACRMSNSIAWGSIDLPPFRQAVAMLADSWNSR